jgi:2-polyprenyl-3-methyl-5-hydroxy-6-metoxy-1,4-benzoquinol methylase
MTTNAAGSSAFDAVPLDRVKSYWNGRPCNIRHSTKAVGTREYFDEVEARKYLVEPHIPAFADFPRWAGKQVLEIGCGIGTDTINFARHGAHVTAVELSEESLAVARQRAEVFGLASQITFMSGNAEELTGWLPRRHYDLIYSFGVIHHTPHPERVLEQIRQLSDPETVVKLMVYHRHSWKVLWILLSYGRGRFWRLRELIAQHSEAQTGCPVTYSYTRREFGELLRKHGFRPQAMDVDHIFPYRIPDYVQYRYVKEWYFRWLPQPLFRTLERHWGWHLLATALGPVPDAVVREPQQEAPTSESC